MKGSHINKFSCLLILFLGHVLDGQVSPQSRIARSPLLMGLEHLEFIKKNLSLDEDRTIDANEYYAHALPTPQAHGALRRKRIITIAPYNGQHTSQSLSPQVREQM